MNWLHYTLLLAIATNDASPLPTYRSFSRESAQEVDKPLGQSIRNAYSEDLEDTNYVAKSRKIDSFGQKARSAAYPGWWVDVGERKEESKGDISRKWDSESDDLQVSSTGWSPQFGKKIQAVISRVNENSDSKFSGNTPSIKAPSTSHTENSTQAEIHKQLDDVNEETPASAKGQDSFTNTFEEGYDIENFYGGNLPHSTQAVYFSPTYLVENVNYGGPSSHVGQDYASIETQKGSHPNFVFDTTSSSGADTITFRGNFPQHGFKLNREDEVEREKSNSEGNGANDIFFSKENLIETSAFPIYQKENVGPPASFAYDAVTVRGGLGGFYSGPAFVSGQNTGQEHEYIGKINGPVFEKIPHNNEYSPQLGILAIPVYTSVRKLEGDYEAQSGLYHGPHIQQVVNAAAPAHIPPATTNTEQSTASLHGMGDLEDEDADGVHESHDTEKIQVNNEATVSEKNQVIGETQVKKVDQVTEDTKVAEDAQVTENSHVNKNSQPTANPQLTEESNDSQKPQVLEKTPLLSKAEGAEEVESTLSAMSAQDIQGTPDITGDQKGFDLETQPSQGLTADNSGKEASTSHDTSSGVAAADDVDGDGKYGSDSPAQDVDAGEVSTELTLQEVSGEFVKRPDLDTAPVGGEHKAENNLRPEEKLTTEKDPKLEVPRAEAVHVNSVTSHTSYGKHNEPHKYHFRYEVLDQSTGDIKSHEEERDGDLTKGTYSLHEPDGTIRTVDYEVKGHSGFQAMVNRKGQAMHQRSKRV